MVVEIKLFVFRTENLRNMLNIEIFAFEYEGKGQKFLFQVPVV